MTKSSKPLRNTSSANKLSALKQINLRAILARDDIDYILSEYNLEKAVPEVKRSIELTQSEAETLVIKIFKRFNIIAITLLDRYAGKPTIVIEEEKDAQDLMHGLLKLHFDDVRREEPTESYAGGPSFIDFLLAKYRIGIEVKMGKHGNRELKKQINDDKNNYRKHGLCDKLLCLVYDPDHNIKNPHGFENDLTDDISGLDTKVFVVPY